MLSLCLPVYRYDARPLVRELLRQTAALPEIDVEILLYDDASPDDGDWGRAELRATSGIRYVELTKNLGRAAIRNKMAREATSSLVVMMDSDGWPNDTFLANYVACVREIRATAMDGQERFLIVGGRNYRPEPPKDNTFHLHWWYGSRRESRTVAQRERAHWLGFQSNNFLVTRSVLLETPFPEAADGYGHEDTLWGQTLKDLTVPQRPWLYHLDNPVIHLGLETGNVFLQKQRQAVRNLRLLKNEHPHLRTRLTDLVEKYPSLLKLAKRIPEKILLRHLTNRARPNLYALDLLKVRWWADQ